MTVRVLCLHGCNQTKKFFQRLLKKWIEIGTKDGIEFHFIQAELAHSNGMVRKGTGSGKDWSARIRQGSC